MIIIRVSRDTMYMYRNLFFWRKFITLNQKSLPFQRLEHSH